jgi:quinohemoprotein ethanol dehydrogenase
MPTVGGNLGNQHYSALTQINRRNLDELGPVWRTHVSAVEPATDDTGQQTTPIVADGVIYLDTPNGEVIAVDGRTGEAGWKWAPDDFETSGTRRGVAVGDGKVYTLADGRVVALDKDTGDEVWVVQPEAPDGESLGQIDRVATVYHDGVVYAHAANGSRAAVAALDSGDGSLIWHLFGGPERGTIFTDVDGESVDAGATWGPVLPDGTECNLEGGATPWMHGSVDPELGMYYMTFGNGRSCRSSQDGQLRPGDNLFSSSLVAVDLETGEYKWHYQSIRHDVWDMDNVHPPVLADVDIGGETRKVVYYGSKSGHLFVLDRTNGRPVLPVDDQPMAQDSRQNHAEAQPFPATRLLPECLVWEPLSPDNIPGDPWRGVPNYNGYQADGDGNLVYTEPNYLDPDTPFVSYPPEYGSDHRQGCMYDPHWDLPVLSTTSQNGGADWSNHSYSHRTNLVYWPYGTNPVAHWRGAGGNGQRARGQYQTGGILAMDASTQEVRWTNHLGTDMAHGQGPLTTASNLLFVGQADGNFLALDAATGGELWRFQTGSGIAGAPITYMIDGQQYVAVFAAGSTNPYGDSVTQGDSLWAFKLGGTYRTEAGSSEGPDTAPLTIRRPVDGEPVDGAEVDNTVYLGRRDRSADQDGMQDSTSTSGMQPTHLRVPVGTTVTFLNPGAETFPNFPNEQPHCATQFFEGLFNARLSPGESFEYTFDRAGEYFFNDCTDPRPTGKIEVVLTPRDVSGALRFAPSRLDLGSRTGVFTGVHGTVTAIFDIPVGYVPDGDVVLLTPLSAAPVAAARVRTVRNRLIVQFDKADLDNNVPEGDAVPLTLVANLLHDGVQMQLTSTATPQIVK